MNARNKKKVQLNKKKKKAKKNKAIINQEKIIVPEKLPQKLFLRRGSDDWFERTSEIKSVHRVESA
jgi:hypothetical protein